MDPNKIRRLPALHEYLRAQPVDMGPPAADYRKNWLAGLVAFFAVAVVTAGYGLAVSVVSATAAGLAVGLAPKLNAYTQSRRVSKYEGLAAIKSHLMGICDRKRVHREIDPGASIALESCARNYLRIRNMLTGPSWTPSRLDDNWRRMRIDALERAEEAMDEAIYLCRSWIGSARKASRRSAWREALGEILEGDFDDVLEAFTERESDEKGMKFDPPLERSSRFALEPVRQISVNLRRLADELEEAQAVIAAPNDEMPSETELEKTLQNLRELKEAESELNQAVENRVGP